MIKLRSNKYAIVVELEYTETLKVSRLKSDASASLANSTELYGIVA